MQLNLHKETVRQIFSDNLGIKKSFGKDGLMSVH
jgi:hypothetical protein